MRLVLAAQITTHGRTVRNSLQQLRRPFDGTLVGSLGILALIATAGYATAPTDTSAPLEHSLTAATQLLTPLATISVERGEDGVQPEDYAAVAFRAVGDERVVNRYWGTTQFSWRPTALWHRPLYFEDVNLERHRRSFGVAQPAVSAAHFFGNLVALPYQVVDQRPHECIYSLGYCRPGNCVAYHRNRRPLSLAGGVGEAAAVVGLMFLIP